MAGDKHAASIGFTLDVVKKALTETPVTPQELDVIVFGGFEEDRAKINDFLSVSAESFELIGPDPLPNDVSFDEATGTFTIGFDLLFEIAFETPGETVWSGLIRANFPGGVVVDYNVCLLYTSPSPRDATLSRMPSSA